MYVQVLLWISQKWLINNTLCLKQTEQKSKTCCGRIRILDDKLPSLMFGKHEQNWI